MNDSRPDTDGQGQQTAPPGAPAGDGGAAGGPARPKLRPGMTGIVVAAVTGALAVAGFVLFERSGTEYRLTAPKTVAGEYERDGEVQKGDSKAFGDKKVPGMESNADVSAEYKSGPGKKLQLGGAYGSVEDPDKAVDWVFAQTAKSLKSETGAKAEGELEAYSPSGFDGDVLKCQEYKISNMSLTMCSWADSSTVGTVSSMILTSDGTSTKPVDLKETAELTAQVRKDALVEAG